MVWELLFHFLKLALCKKPNPAAGSVGGRGGCGMLWEKTISLCRHRVRGDYYMIFIFFYFIMMIQNLVKIPSINSLQLRKLNKTLCPGRRVTTNYWGTPNAAGSALFTPNTHYGYRHTPPEISLLRLSASKPNCPRSAQKFALKIPRAQCATNPDQPALTPWAQQPQEPTQQ